MSDHGAQLTAARDTSAASADVSATLARWLATAMEELARHTPLEGACQECAGIWPCPTCERAEFALGSL